MNILELSIYFKTSEIYRGYSFLIQFFHLNRHEKEGEQQQQQQQHVSSENDPLDPSYIPDYTLPDVENSLSAPHPKFYDSEGYRAATLLNEYSILNLSDEIQNKENVSKTEKIQKDNLNIQKVSVSGLEEFNVSSRIDSPLTQELGKITSSSRHVDEEMSSSTDQTNKIDYKRVNSNIRLNPMSSKQDIFEQIFPNQSTIVLDELTQQPGDSVEAPHLNGSTEKDQQDNDFKGTLTSEATLDPFINNGDEMDNWDQIQTMRENGEYSDDGLQRKGGVRDLINSFRDSTIVSNSLLNQNIDKHHRTDTIYSNDIDQSEIQLRDSITDQNIQEKLFTDAFSNNSGFHNFKPIETFEDIEVRQLSTNNTNNVFINTSESLDNSLGEILHQENTVFRHPKFRSKFSNQHLRDNLNGLLSNIEAKVELTEGIVDTTLEDIRYINTTDW